jgi:co-chaperonin GroES (HSP10)
LLGPLYTPAFREAFPDVSAPYSPFGYNVLIQLRQPVMKTRGGIIKPGEVEDTERYRTQAALVRALGVAAYTHRDTGKSWVEGAWCKPGDFVRAPMFGGDRVDITHKVGDDKVKTTFVFIKDSDLIALVTGDPLNIENS